MGRALTITLLAAVTACAGASPRERYIEAVNQRMEGNATAYYDGLISLANDEPDTRAGRRARATLEGGTVTATLAVAGVLAAIAIPNFMKFQDRAAQAEAKTNLKALYTAQRAHFAEMNKYCTTFAACGYVPPGNLDYFYFLTPNEAVGATGVADPDLLRLQASVVLSSMGVEPGIHGDGFLIVAVGNLDADRDLDVWAIDEQGSLVNLLNDLD